MVRKFFKKKSTGGKLDLFIDKYNIPRAYLSTNRKNITKGLFIGLFIAFIPMPMQMLAVLAMMPFAKFNVPIALSMVWLSNPVTMPAMYYIEYLTGSFFLQTQIEPVVMSVEWFSINLKNIFIVMLLVEVLLGEKVNLQVILMPMLLSMIQMLKECQDLN